MKTAQVVKTFILISSLLISGIVQANTPSSYHEPAEPVMEVSFNGIEGEFLLFTVKATVHSKSFFAIRNEAGEDLHREVYYEGDNLRKIRIPKADIKNIHFVLSQKKKQCTRSFKIDTHYRETVDVQIASR